MRISDVIVEAPLDTPLDPAGTAVGKGVGKAGYGAGYAAGKIASKLGGGSSTTNPNVSKKDRSANILTALGQGIKSGTMKWATGKGSDIGKNQNVDLLRKVYHGKTVPQTELQQLISELPSIQLGWRVDRNAVNLALNKTLKGQPLDANDKNAIKAMVHDLEEV